ncbi:MAG TPA: patatin-like phospholipase family protein [Nocardioidaceae bacterium]|nr:patatin-like phospholipase family protein [Nocardioidaceae bacterium]
MSAPTRVALALGSGGARGYAHIGVIAALEERGYDIVSISGTSMGALVGGLHAAGKLDGYSDWVTDLNHRDLIRLLDPSIKAPGVIRADKILARVSELLDGARIEELPIPFTAVATDLIARREVWFQQGPVDVAIRASIALPSIITPVMLNGRLLADGGLMNPIPIAPMASTNADLTVAVSLAGDPEGQSGRAAVSESAEPRPAEEWMERFRRTAAQVLDRDVVRLVTSKFGAARSTTPGNAAEEVEEEIFGALPPGLRTLDMMELSLDTMQSVVTRYRLAGYPPDLLITIPKNACRALDFHKAAEMIPLGRKLALEALDRAASPGSE